MRDIQHPQLDRTLTEEHIEKLRVQCTELNDPLVEARLRARYLGASMRGPRTALFGFWAPELADEEIPEEQVALELFVPPADADPAEPHQSVHMERYRIPVVPEGEYLWAVVHGVCGGTAARVGTLYHIVFTDRAGVARRIVDPLAHSVPWGAAAPAELYNMEDLLAQRTDQEYFRTLLEGVPQDADGIPRIPAPLHMLEIHVPTATAEGTLAALTDYLTEAVSAPHPTAFQQACRDYDAVQLMPIEPTILFEEGEEFWVEEWTDEGTIVHLHRPYTTNWGYDVITAASPAPNPALLATGRPDELLQFITAMHTLREHPVKVVLDVVYGHADNQALALLNRHFFAGANMYGQNLNYRHPVVRAVLLEMLRRKSNYGVDGIRVDGAQDFKYWVEKDWALYHDDEYLALMNETVQEVAGFRYRPWMVFEDGRPWPRDDWELSSTYREVTKNLPNVVQWGPLTFAHNTPFLFTFWISKWWRIRELLEFGEHWITGTSNHDTLRRGTQVDPEERVNTYLGTTLPEIFSNGYDNPASHMLDTFLPGIPMDFLNANVHAPWSFIRNTDWRWAIKVVSEEARFLDWAVPGERFSEPWAFPRMKAMGFRSLQKLRQFMNALEGAIRTTTYHPDALAHLLGALTPPIEGPGTLTGDLVRAAARAWMDDVHEFCNISHYQDPLENDDDQVQRVSCARTMRLLRRNHRWLQRNMNLRPHGPDWFDYQHPANGSVIFEGIRFQHADGSGEAILAVVNAEGAPRTVVPGDLSIPGFSPADRWRLLAATPMRRTGTPQDDHRGTTAVPETPADPVTLHNGEGVLFIRQA